MKAVEEVSAIAGNGLMGCRHARSGSSRQVLMIDGETLDALGLAPGDVKENLTMRGMRLNDLSMGQQIQIGDVVVEVTGPCEPCARMDEIRAGLQQELDGRRGILCRVLTTGTIRKGDSVRPAQVAATNSGGEA
jgi:MOSC domain-containing protein YiiM